MGGDHLWDALGAVGELVGAIAVVATLGYLAVQIRQNTNAVKAASHHAITDFFNHMSVRVLPSFCAVRRLTIQKKQRLTLR